MRDAFSSPPASSPPIDSPSSSSLPKFKVFLPPPPKVTARDTRLTRDCCAFDLCPSPPPLSSSSSLPASLSQAHCSSISFAADLGAGAERTNSSSSDLVFHVVSCAVFKKSLASSMLLRFHFQPPTSNVVTSTLSAKPAVFLRGFSFDEVFSIEDEASAFFVSKGVVLACLTISGGGLSGSF